LSPPPPHTFPLNKPLFFQIALIIITLALALTACPTGGGSKPAETPVKIDYTLTLFGKTITVTDTRTGANDKSIEEMGIYKKLQDAVAAINGNASMDTAKRETFDRVLAKGRLKVRWKKWRLVLWEKQTFICFNRQIL
jgi:hypothetical protein